MQPDPVVHPHTGLPAAAAQRSDDAGRMHATGVTTLGISTSAQAAGAHMQQLAGEVVEARGAPVARAGGPNPRRGARVLGGEALPAGLGLPSSPGSPLPDVAWPDSAARAESFSGSHASLRSLLSLHCGKHTGSTVPALSRGHPHSHRRAQRPTAAERNSPCWRRRMPSRRRLNARDLKLQQSKARHPDANTHPHIVCRFQFDPPIDAPHAFKHPAHFTFSIWRAEVAT